MEKERETLSLADAGTHLLEECRMVLPGVQALFGFQLIAVFNNGFSEKLSHAEQCVHLLALALVAIAGALIMSPASYHRQTNPRAVSADFIRLGGRLLLSAMVPLLLGIGLDFYLIARVVLQSPVLAAAEAMGLALFFALCWFALPRLR
jgi:small-conductance mechanosensitive channel